MRRHFTDRRGRAIVIRPAEAGDAAGLLRLSNDIRAEGVYYVAEEPRLSVEEYSEYLQALDKDRNLVLAACDDTRIVGTITAISGYLRKTRHVAELGIGIAAGYRNAGIGAALLATAIDWCRGRGFIRLELSVFASNERAIALYRRFGFCEEGRRRAKYAIDGRYVDEVLMGRLLE
ncbi:MAG: N-acetyltransferase family protein [Chloroflexota bacterium]